MGYLLFLSLFVIGFTYALFFSALPKLEAAAIALYTYIDPIVAVLLSTFLLHETLHAWHVPGCGFDSLADSRTGNPVFS